MIYDLNLYRHSIKPQVKTWCDAKAHEPRVEQVGPLALATQCDIVIIAHYVGELYGYTPELNALIDKLLAFYRPDAVINHEESANADNGI